MWTVLRLRSGQASWLLALQMTVAVEPTARPKVTAQEVAPGVPAPVDRRSTGRSAERVQANPGRDTRGTARERRPRQRRHVFDSVPRCRRDPLLLLQGGIGGARDGRRKNGDAEFSTASR